MLSLPYSYDTQSHSRDVWRKLGRTSERL